MDNTQLQQSIEAKYTHLGENPSTYLKGLLHAKETDYWSYIQLETLLSLQNPRTHFEDEEVFIIYHQLTELILKLVLNELKKLTECIEADENIYISKLNRINRYTQMLINSFAIMRHGMNYDDYNSFRSALAPASGFQSAQFRYIELYCTSLENLVTHKNKISEASRIEDLMELQYWKAAGINPKTGEKTLTLRQFEKKYSNRLTQLAENLRNKTLNDRLECIESPSQERINLMRTFDYLYNIKWPIVHLETAAYYLDSKGDKKEATGSSDWKKYLHPRNQRRIFFPSLWSTDELKNWGDPCFFEEDDFKGL